jgi:hypothetical protein
LKSMISMNIKALEQLNCQEGGVRSIMALEQLDCQATQSKRNITA